MVWFVSVFRFLSTLELVIFSRAGAKSPVRGVPCIGYGRAVLEFADTWKMDDPGEVYLWAWLRPLC